MEFKSDEKTSTERSNAKYLAKVLKDPCGLAVTLYKTFSAFISAGFSNDQAMELTKHTIALIIGIGGLAD